MGRSVFVVNSEKGEVLFLFANYVYVEIELLDIAGLITPIGKICHSNLDRIVENPLDVLGKKLK